MNRVVLSRIIVAVGLSVTVAMAAVPSNQPWKNVSTSDSSAITKRHETAGVAVNGKLYVFGGRRTLPVERYDPVARNWTTLGTMPGEFNHFQPVVIGSMVYLLCGFDSGPGFSYPNEKNLAEIYRFNTNTNQFDVVDQVPASRRRGGAAAVAYGGKVYVVGGNNQGHAGGAVDWFDVWDPATGNWTVLPDAPNARDHFQAVVIGNELVVAGGRRSSYPNTFGNAVLPVDIYEFDTGQWRSGRNIPTARAGAVVASWGNEMLVAGGEINNRSTALDDVEAYDVQSNQWRSLQPMNKGRHGAASAVLGSVWHVVSGSDVLGGAGETESHESLQLSTQSALDTDGDGLSDYAETNQYQTDPESADTDEDGLDDGVEVDLDSNPLLADTDSDGLNDADEHTLHGTDLLDADSDGDTLLDGQEVNEHRSNPLESDSDGDDLDDALEVALGSNPNSSDTDADGLSDALEYNQYGTSLTSADSDSDGLRDRDEVMVHMTNPVDSDSDADGLNDGVEVNEYASNPLQADTDNDSLEDGYEVLELGTSPVNADTDGDGLLDPDDPTPTSANKRRGGGALFGSLSMLGMAVFWRARRRYLARVN